MQLKHKTPSSSETKLLKKIKIKRRRKIPLAQKEGKIKNKKMEKTQKIEKTKKESNRTVYVGDLSLKTVESDLYKIFSTVGSVVTIKLVKPATENFPSYTTSYAYVLFSEPEEATEAVAKLNFFKVHEKEMRVMLFDRERVKSAHGGNIVIKNLSGECDSKTLHDTFSIFGEILSCKVALNSQGKCKGFGFVQFKSKSSAKKALKFGTEMQMDGYAIKVEKYEKNYKTKSADGVFTNVFFKNFPAATTEEELRGIFGAFGKVSSFYFATKPDGALKGFGFANFEEAEDARHAIEGLSGKDVFAGGYPEPFYVQQAQSRQQRLDSLSSAFEKLSLNGLNYKRNLYVTRLPGTYGKEEVGELFGQFGQIISVCVGKDNVVNDDRNWAYVCFSTPDEASIAVEKGNEIYIDDVKINVTYFKNKTERDQDYINDNMQRYALKTGLRQSIGRPTPYLFKKADSIRYNLQRKPYDKKQMGGDLYSLVLSLAPTFSPKWKNLGIKDEEEFATKITDLLLKKSSTDVRNMIGLGNVLTQNISDTLNDFTEVSCFDGDD